MTKRNSAGMYIAGNSKMHIPSEISSAVKLGKRWGCESCANLNEA